MIPGFKTSATLGAMALAAVSLAQSFTIVRPADNSRVREKIKVLIPAGAIPAQGYVGVFLDGKFLEAVRPPRVGNFHQYILDTKGRGIPDTPAGKRSKLELVLYVDYGDTARVVDRSSVDITISNRANIRIPGDGLRLRYSYRPGAEMFYTLLIRQTAETVSEQQNRLGGRPAELPLDFEKIRLLYAVDNAYPGGSGLMRMQVVPPKGKDYAVLTPSSATEPQVFTNQEMAPLYMKMTSTGQQVWGNVPIFYPFDGFSGVTGDSAMNLYASFPLPILPTKAVRPGDVWAAKFQVGAINLEKHDKSTSVVRTFPGRGEFIRTEWENGRPCAVIKNSIVTAARSLEAQKLEKQGAAMSGDNKAKIEETIWFALDTRQVIKVVREQTTEVRIEGAGGGFGAPTGGSGSSSGGGTKPRPGGARMGVINDSTEGMRQTGPPRPGGGQRPGGFGPVGPGGRPGGVGPGAGGGGAMLLRIRSQQIMILEK